MRGLLGLSLLCLAGSCGGEAPSDEARPRLLVVGWDGASFRMIDRLLAEGRLPHARGLIERGANARLESTVIPISAAAWTSAVTGKGPGDTGVYTFFEPVEGSYDVRLISARSLRAAPIWRILTWRGRRSIVFGVPITYPPEPISGTMVAGMLSPFRSDYAWPPEYASELRGRGFEPDLDVWTEARPVGWDDFDEQLAIKEAAVLELLARKDWDMAFVVFKSLDVVSHLAYDVDFHEHLGPVYDRLDSILGSLMEEVGPDTNVMLLSDHGFHVYGSGFNLHAWLVEHGFSVRKEKIKRFGIEENDPYALRERQIILQLRNELDWDRTRAFALESEGNFGAIRLNVAGRETEGCVGEDQIAALIEDISAGLRSVVDAEGNPLVTRVFRGSELYPGPHADLVPDLLFEVDPEHQVFSDVREARIVGPYDIALPDHDRHGILIAAGPSIRRIAARGDARIADIAPTALHLLGEPVYAEMTGRVFTEMLDDDSSVITLREADDPRARAAPRSGNEPFSAEELKELEDRLQALGYGN